MTCALSLSTGNEPCLVVAFCGLPGAGKSRLATGLAHYTGWRHLDRDRIRAQSFPDGRTDSEAKRIVERQMREQMARALSEGGSVILDGMTLVRRGVREEWSMACIRAGGHWLPVYVECPLELAIERVRRDSEHPAGDRDPALVRRVARTLEPPDSGEGALRVDGRAPPDPDILHQSLIVQSRV